MIEASGERAFGGRQRNVRARFIGSGLVYRDSLTTRGTLASVSESFMEKPSLDPGAMWLDGSRHPKVGVLGPTPSWFNNHLPVAYTGKRLKTWQQTEPWNREKVGADGAKVLDLTNTGDFWEWLENNALAPPATSDLSDLTLLGERNREIGTLTQISGPPNYDFGVPVAPPISEVISPHCVGSRSWVQSKLSNCSSSGSSSSSSGSNTATAGTNPSPDESLFYQRLVASVILPDSSYPPSSQKFIVPASQLTAQSTQFSIPEIGLRKRTLIELGAVGLLRESDGDGNWLSLEVAAAKSDKDSQVCREIRSDTELLKRQELLVNPQIALLRKRLERGEACFTATREDNSAQARVLHWQKLQRKKQMLLQKKFEEKLGIE